VLARLALAFLIPIALFAQCDCVVLPPKEAMGYAEVVFRGTVQSVHGTAVFHVTRVWKGPVGRTFEMSGIESSEWCHGFLPRMLRVGNELIVYASRIDPSNNIYFPMHCQTALVSKAYQIRKLGRGHKPKP